MNTMNKSVLKNRIKDIELMIIASGISLEELIFERLDMSWPELLYDIHDRLVERLPYFEDLLLQFDEEEDDF
jgi:hypothetical protein